MCLEHTQSLTWSSKIFCKNYHYKLQIKQMKLEKWADLAGVTGRLDGWFQAVRTEGCSALCIQACECAKSITTCVPITYVANAGPKLALDFSLEAVSKRPFVTLGPWKVLSADRVRGRPVQWRERQPHNRVHQILQRALCQAFGPFTGWTETTQHNFQSFFRHFLLKWPAFSLSPERFCDQKRHFLPHHNRHCRSCSVLKRTMEDLRKRIISGLAASQTPTQVRPDTTFKAIRNTEKIFEETGGCSQALRDGRPRSVRTQSKVSAVEKSVAETPRTSIRKWSCDFRMTCTTMKQMVKVDLSMMSRVAKGTPPRTVKISTTLKWSKKLLILLKSNASIAIVFSGDFLSQELSDPMNPRGRPTNPTSSRKASESLTATHQIHREREALTSL